MRGTIVFSLAIATALVELSAAGAEPTKEECVAANSDAQDLRHASKLRAAREKLALCVSTSCPGPVREDCAARLDEVNKALPTLVLVVKDSAGNDVSARATMDGAPFADRLDGTAVPVDPGEHHFVVESEGFAKAEKTLIVREGDKDRRERIVLARAPTERTPLAAAQVEPAGQGNTQRVIALMAGGVGLVGLVIGAATGIAGASKHDSLAGECPGNGCPDSLRGEVDAFHTLRTWSTVGYVIGVVGLAGGAALWFTAPKARASVGLWVGPTAAGVGAKF